MLSWDVRISLLSGGGSLICKICKVRIGLLSGGGFRLTMVLPELVIFLCCVVFLYVLYIYLL